MTHLYTMAKKFKNSKKETFLGVIIDNKLIFDSHINRMCKKAGHKLSALSQISAFIHSNKRQILFQSMIKLQFSYCPLILDVILEDIQQPY